MTVHRTKICLAATCANAGLEMPISSFGVCKSRPDGRNGYCRPCALRKVTENRERLAEYIKARQKPKVCGAFWCERAGQVLEPEEFSLNTARPDGRNAYCRHCTNRKVQDYRRRLGSIPEGSAIKSRANVKLSPAQRIVQALEITGTPLQARELARCARLTLQELSDALPLVHGSERDMKILSRNGTGPRVYYLKPEPEPVQERIDADKHPALSFSTLGSFSNLGSLFPVSGGRKS